MNKQIFSKIVSSTSFYIEVKDTVEKSDLTRVENNLLTLISRFFGKYSRVPTREELLLFFEDLPDGEKKFISEYKEYVNEAKLFPRSKYKDQIDASSGAFTTITAGGGRIGVF